MKRTTKLLQEERRQVNVPVDTRLWKEARIQAVRDDSSLTDIIEEALRDYLAKRKEQAETLSEAVR